MPRFDAGSALEALEYDFSTADNPKGPAGTVPEPTTAQVTRFYDDLTTGIREVFPPERFEGFDVSTRVGTRRFLESLDYDDSLAVHQHTMSVFAAVCSDKPSVADQETLPWRLLQRWHKAVQEWLRPEA